jgi:hypothetical protein
MQEFEKQKKTLLNQVSLLKSENQGLKNTIEQL